MAAPVAFVWQTYGVRVGVSLVEIPSAPGAPFDQSRISFFISARDSMRDANKIAEVKSFFVKIMSHVLAFHATKINSVLK